MAFAVREPAALRQEVIYYRAQFSTKERSSRMIKPSKFPLLTLVQRDILSRGRNEGVSLQLWADLIAGFPPFCDKRVSKTVRAEASCNYKGAEKDVLDNVSAPLYKTYFF